MIVTHEVLGPHPAGGTTRTVLATPGQIVPDDLYAQWVEDPDISVGPIDDEGFADDENSDVSAAQDAAGGAAGLDDLEALKARAVELGINPGNSKAETLATKIAEAEETAASGDTTGDAGD